MNILDLYAGMGGFAEGFKEFFEILDAVDIWEDACKTYGMNQPGKIHTKSVDRFINDCIPKDFDGILFDGIIGGPPCQEFSRLNQKPDLKSVRANQLFVFIEVVKNLQPKFAMIENVATLPKIMKEAAAMTLQKHGYRVIHRTIKAHNYGSVQLRRRWILTACKSRTIFPVEKPNSRCAAEILTGGESYMKMSEKIREGLKHVPSGKWVPLPWAKWKEYFIVDPSKPLPAIVNVTKNRIVRPDRSGYVSLEEIKLAQGFPEQYKMFGTLSSKAQQLANAIPTELANSFAKEFFEKLK